MLHRLSTQSSVCSLHKHSSEIIMLSTKKQFGVVLVQMLVTDDKLTNIKHAERLIRHAVEKHRPKLVVLPEYFNTKWDKMLIEKHAELFPTGETFMLLQKLAKELDIFLVGGSIPERDTNNVLFNTTTVFAPNGMLIAKYRKIHLLDMDVEKTWKLDDRDLWKLRETEYVKAGKELAHFIMDGVKVGLGIGYDLCFGELTRLYRLQGVEMVIFPTLIPTRFGDLKWEQLTRVRAIDNQLYVLSVAQARDDTKLDLLTHGRSLLVDFRGRVLTRAGVDEELLHTFVDIEDLEMYRKKLNLFGHKRDDIYETIYKL